MASKLTRCHHGAAWAELFPFWGRGRAGPLLPPSLGGQPSLLGRGPWVQAGPWRPEVLDMNLHFTSGLSAQPLEASLFPVVTRVGGTYSTFCRGTEGRPCPQAALSTGQAAPVPSPVQAVLGGAGWHCGVESGPPQGQCRYPLPRGVGKGSHAICPFWGTEHKLSRGQLQGSGWPFLPLFLTLSLLSQAEQLQPGARMLGPSSGVQTFLGWGPASPWGLPSTLHLIPAHWGFLPFPCQPLTGPDPRGALCPLTLGPWPRAHEPRHGFPS